MSVGLRKSRGPFRCSSSSLGWASAVIHQHLTTLKRVATGKHSSLLGTFKNVVRKKFNNIGPRSHCQNKTKFQNQNQNSGQNSNFPIWKILNFGPKRPTNLHLLIDKSRRRQWRHQSRRWRHQSRQWSHQWRRHQQKRQAPIQPGVNAIKLFFFRCWWRGQ